MSERRRIHCNPAGLVSDWRVLDDLERAHGRRDVKESVVHFDGGSIGLLERRLVVAGVNARKVVLEEPADAALLTHFVQRIRVLLHAEHGRHPRVEVHLDHVAAPGLLVPVPSHPHDLLRSCGEWWNYQDMPRGGQEIDVPPAHLITPAGCVNTALPDLNASTSAQTLSHVSYE